MLGVRDFNWKGHFADILWPVILVALKLCLVMAVRDVREFDWKAALMTSFGRLY